MVYPCRDHERCGGTAMSVFRFGKNAAPTADQSERFMIGAIGEEYFGCGGEILLVEYPEAFYLRDDIEGTGILYTGAKDKRKAFNEAMLRARRYDQRHRLPTGTC